MNLPDVDCFWTDFTQTIEWEIHLLFLLGISILHYRFFFGVSETDVKEQSSSLLGKTRWRSKGLSENYQWRSVKSYDDVYKTPCISKHWIINSVFEMVGTSGFVLLRASSCSSSEDFSCASSDCFGLRSLQLFGRIPQVLWGGLKNHQDSRETNKLMDVLWCQGIWISILIGIFLVFPDYQILSLAQQ